MTMDLQAKELRLEDRVVHIKKGGAQKYHEKNEEQGKLFVRDRLQLLFDAGFEIEDALFANNLAEDLPADGVVTAMGKINGQMVCVMANDSTVKAGSWGKRTVEKIIRIQETAEKLSIAPDLSGGFGGRPHYGPNRNVPWTTGRWTNLLQSGEVIG